MGETLFRKTMEDLRAQVLGWGVGIGLLLVLVVVVYPSIAELYGDLELSDTMMAFTGTSADLGTFEGYLSNEFFSYGSVILAVFVIMAGTAALAGEEGDGTLDLLLAQPVSRSRLLLLKFATLCIATALIILISTAFFWLSILFVDVEFNAWRAVQAFALLWPFEMTVAALSILASLLLPGRKAAGMAVALVLIGSYVLESMSNLVSLLEPFRPLLLTYYYDSDAALAGQASWSHTVLLVVVTIAALVASLVAFQRRDVGIYPSARALSLLWRHRRGDARA